MKRPRPQTVAKILVVLALVGMVCGMVLVALISDDSPVVFESAESSASDHGSIYNRVSWSSSRDYDVWVMQQSQKGWSADFDTWDRLVIQLDKRSRPYQATFIQAEPGPIVTRGLLASLEYGVPCLSCHANGPRALRPVKDSSSQAAISMWDQWRIGLWNIRIATYGRILAKPAPLSSGLKREVPLSLGGAPSGWAMDSVLRSKTCALCHHDKHWLGRGYLSQEHATSIHFLVERGFMPPLGFSLSSDEKQEILKFSSYFP